MKVWTNTFAAECWEEEFEKLDEKAVAGRAEDYNPDDMIPAGVLRVEAGCDVQEDRLELEFVGCGEGEETWGLGYHVLHGDTQADAVWEELDRLLGKLFRHPSGAMLPVHTAFIDSGARQDRVLQFTGPRRSRGVFASKGYNSPGKPVPILPRKASINNKRKVPQWIVGVTAAKTVIYSRIMLAAPGPGYMHYPKGHGYDARYFRQLTSERRMTRYSHGRPYYIYEAGNRRNEPLDIRVYALAAHRRVTFDPVRLKKELEVTPGVAPVTPDVAPPAHAKPNWREGMEPAVIAHVPVTPASVPASSFTLPAYVPMSQRIRGGGGAAMFKG
jgi:phage terminase large subunit GpA-like protein